MSRVSDRAKFCHSCGVELGVEMTVDEITELSCPVCGEEATLVSRKLGSNRAAVMECQRCTGLWLSTATFGRLTSEAAKQAAAAPSATSSDQTNSPPIPASTDLERWAYRPCVVCQKLMHRTQYSRGSGVIIDTCRHHGTWLDAHELPQILAWIRSGGPAEVQATEKRKKGEHLADATLRELASRREEHEGPFSGRSRTGSIFGDQAFDLLRDSVWDVISPLGWRGLLFRLDR